MGELVRIRPSERPISGAEAERLRLIRWVHDEPYPDGNGTRSVFGLSRIMIPVIGQKATEAISINREGELRRNIVDHSSIIGYGGESDRKARYARLIFDRLGIHDPISVYLVDPSIAVAPFDPDRINAIGDFVIEADRALVQDRQSRMVLQIQRDLVDLYRSYVQSGVVDTRDEAMRELVEGASVQLQLLEKTRGVLPQEIRDLGPRAEELGIRYVDENTSSDQGLSVDPELIPLLYTPETDSLPLPKFIDHIRYILGNPKAIKRL